SATTNKSRSGSTEQASSLFERRPREVHDALRSFMLLTQSERRATPNHANLRRGLEQRSISTAQAQLPAGVVLLHLVVLRAGCEQAMSPQEHFQVLAIDA